MAILQTSPLLSIIIVNYHTDSYVLKLLDRLGSDKKIQIIVVDNSNSLRLEKKYSNVEYVSVSSNNGFSAGNNIGIHHAKGEWVLFLNSDTEVTSADVLKLLAIVQEEGYRAGAPKLLYPEGKIQRNVGRFDSFFTHPLNYLFARPRWVKSGKNISVDFATGAALLVHSSLFRTVGIWDEHFFMYFEDLDYCLRMKAQGISILYVPEITIVHHEGTSANQNMNQKNSNYTAGLTYYLRKHRGNILSTINTIFHFLR